MGGETGKREITREELLELGFEDGGGSLLRKTYRDFVIDALPAVMTSSYERIELRGGSLGVRIPARLESLEELRVLVNILDRAAARG